MNTPVSQNMETIGHGAGIVVNDRHSCLNATAVQRLVQPESLVQLSEIIKTAAARKLKLSVAGGRHAMGGQQFLQNGLLVDMTALDRVLEFDPLNGTVRAEAGVTWPRFLQQLEELQPAAEPFWTFAQKQTGADNLTLGGAIAANIHGRGLTMKPFVSDVISLDLVGLDGRLVRCSRSENPELFRLVIGGYGLFGVVYAVTLQLVRREVVQRLVKIGLVDELIPAFDEAIRSGCLYGDFQFAIDPRSDDFLRRGVFAVYKTVPGGRIPDGPQKSLSPADWERMFYLAHANKARVYTEYTAYYKSTHGQLYFSDRHQLSYYPEGYHASLDQKLGAACPGSEMISELYVPRANLSAFLCSVRIFARRYGWNIIYGTIRLIERDTETFLAWASESWACVVFNICVEHSRTGLEQARSAFRNLIQIAMNYGGSYYLTYHKWATSDQLLACYPQFPEFLAHKRRFDPDEIFVSNWYLNYQSLGCRAATRSPFVSRNGR
jgi:FAD/FMN-containing dehydrogenase